MDSVTLTKQNRLFWLGRYAERVAATIPYLIELYDCLIDGKSPDVWTVCNKLGVPNVYADMEDFCRRYTFDESNPFSVRSSAENMLGNGMVLRETISSDTLAYLQMARDCIVEAASSEIPTMQLQAAVDCIMAFRGSFDDYIVSQEARNIIKTGRSVERLSFVLRTHWQTRHLDREFSKLLSRMERSGLAADDRCLQTILDARKDPVNADQAALLRAVEGMFTV